MNTYLIVGTINYFKEKEVKKIIKDNPYITFDLECSTLEELITEASFSSMFDDKKYIIVKLISKFNEDTLEYEDTLFYGNTEMDFEEVRTLIDYVKDEI